MYSNVVQYNDLKQYDAQQLERPKTPIRGMVLIPPAYARSSTTKNSGNNSTGSAYSSTDQKTQIGSKQRDEVMFNLCKALGTRGSTEASKNKAREIEAEVWQHFSNSSKEYFEKYRQLWSNLKKNEQLRARVLAEEILVTDLVHMSTEELADETTKEYRKLRARQQESATVRRDDPAEGTGRRTKKTARGIEEIEMDE